MRIKLLLTLLAILVTASAAAEQSQQFDDYIIHYNALTTNQLSPEVAQAYGIVRSGSRALLNISVLKDDGSGVPTAVTAGIEAAAQNLAAQRREVSMREIKEQDAVYYIGIVSVADAETLSFEVEVTPDGSDQTYSVRFRQQFFTR